MTDAVDSYIDQIRKDIIIIARSDIGNINYQWYESPKDLQDPLIGYNCYGWLWVTAAHRGIYLPFGCYEMYEAMPRTDKPKPADLVFLNGKHEDKPSHVGFYALDGKILHLPQSPGTVVEESLDRFSIKCFCSIEPYIKEMLENARIRRAA